MWKKQTPKKNAGHRREVKVSEPLMCAELRSQCVCSSHPVNSRGVLLMSATHRGQTGVQSEGSSPTKPLAETCSLFTPLWSFFFFSFLLCFKNCPFSCLLFLMCQGALCCPSLRELIRFLFFFLLNLWSLWLRPTPQHTEHLPTPWNKCFALNPL